MSTDLKPCPFCGGPAAYHPVDYPESPNETLVGCMTNDCIVQPGVEAPTREQALAAWNRRADRSVL